MRMTDALSKIGCMYPADVFQIHYPVNQTGKSEPVVSHIVGTLSKDKQSDFIKELSNLKFGGKKISQIIRQASFDPIHLKEEKLNSYSGKVEIFILKNVIDSVLVYVNQASGSQETRSYPTEKYYPELINNSPDIHLIINYKTQTIDFISNSIRKILDLNPDDFINQSPNKFFSLLHPEDYEQNFQLWKEIPSMEDLEIYLFFTEYRLKNSKGNYIWLSHYHKLIRENEQPALLICNIRDISDYKNIEFALRKNEERLSNAIDATQEGIWEYMPDNQSLYLSDHCKEIFGLNKTDKSPSVDSLIEMLHPEDQLELIDKLKDFYYGENNSISVEYRIKHQSKGYIWIETNAKKTSKDPPRITGSNADITIKKETSQRLKESETLFRELAENLGDVIWITEKERILFINSAFDKIWGRDKEEVIQNPDEMIKWILPEDKDKFANWFHAKQIESYAPVTEQFRIKRPDGEIRWIWGRLFPIYNDDNKIYRIVSISSDITEQKEFEETLQIAKAKAQESDMLKSNFLANISHEIRTPMNGIIGFAELITRLDITENIRHTYIDIIKKSSEQLNRIIDDIIDFAKIESNQVVIKKEKFDLNKLLNETYIFFTNQIANQQIKNIKLSYEKHYADDNIFIVADEHRIRRILYSLLDNALKYTKQGSVKFGYKAIDESIEFFVEDTGIGIQKDSINKIFERFRQEDEGHTRKYGGTGLGLAISKGLVELMGGSIWVESTQDKGSKFSFTIPVEFVEGQTQPQEIITRKKYYWPDKHILVAEDDQLNFEYISVLLEPTNVYITRTVNGSETVRACQSEKYDLILMDIQLPVLNGLQATKLIRESGINIPIIAQTAYALNDDREKCLSAGCDEYITKPLKAKELLNLINEFLA